MAVNNTSLFAAGNIAFSSLNDVFAQANVYGSSVTGNQNLLVLTPTGVKELTRGGTAVSNLALLGAGYQVRGITMDRSGLIYGVSDNGNAGINSALLIYAPAAVPEPEGDGLVGLGCAVLCDAPQEDQGARSRLSAGGKHAAHFDASTFNVQL